MYLPYSSPNKVYPLSEFTEQIASENMTILKDYAVPSLKWRSNAKKMEDARYGAQFSSAEKNELLLMRQAPLPISVSTAICDTADAMTVASRPTVYVAPILYPDDDESAISRNVASIYTQLIQKDWYDSLGALQFDRVAKDCSNVGHGLMGIFPKFEFNEFKCNIGHLTWRYFYGDPSSVDPLYRDMDNMLYSFLMSEKAAFKFAKSIVPDLTWEQFINSDFCHKKYSSTIVGEEEDITYAPKMRMSRKLVRFNYRTTLEENEVYLVIPENYQGNTNFDFRTVDKITPELEQLAKNGHVSFKKERRLYLTEYTAIGGLGFKKVYPISQHNIVPFVYDHRDTPYPYGRMWYLYPLQRALNKAVMSTVLNMSILNNVKIMAERKTIVNKEEFKYNASTPGVIIEYDVPVQGFSQPPQIIKSDPMGEQYFAFPKYLIYMMEYISGISGVMQGDSSNAPDTFSTVASLSSAGGMKIKRRMAYADAALSIVGQVTADFYKNYAPVNGASSIMETGKEDEKLLAYNKLLVTRFRDEKGDLKFDLKIDPMTDLSRGFRKVRFTSQSSSGYESATQAQVLMLLATQMKVPQLIPMILELLNIPKADKVIASIDQTNQLSQQVKQLSSQLEQGGRDAKIRDNQIFQMAINLEKAKAKGQLDKELEKLKTNPQRYLSEAFQSGQMGGAPEYNQFGADANQPVPEIQQDQE